MTLSFQSVLDAETRINRHKIATPILTSDRLNQKLSFDLFVKADGLQHPDQKTRFAETEELDKRTSLMRI